MKPEFDLYDAKRYEQSGPPYEAFRWLRENAPVYRHPEPKGPGFWAVTRYQDIVHCSTHPMIFSSWIGGTNIEDYGEDDLVAMRAMLANMDPPAHSRYRKLVSTGFTPRMITRLEPHLRQLARDIIGAVAARGGCDFVTDLAVEFPLQTITEFLGVPLDERKKIFDWSNTLIAWDDPEYQGESDPRTAAMQIWGYANELAERRRAEGNGTDLVSVLINSKVDGEMLGPQQFELFFLLLSVAGNETTRNLISGGMLALFENPEQLARLKADPSLMPTAVDEMLRWVTPVNYFRRTVSEDTELGGQKLKAGDKIAMYYTAANRDTAVFTNPDQFDVTRNPNEHLTFGVGEHFCLGASLARLEIRIFFEELFQMLPDIALVGPVRRLRSNFINGIKSMPVKFTPVKNVAGRDAA
ncbi:MAG: cytochrome P450 [Deltaproteobacteria bacterium]|nr:cytochrome P450 [Deltaproteobacteria bacterium]